ncbi:hypothetical protein XSR1_110063 [Xenorhabdus szentirmaii DSM 16338]|uniref:Uncharacterized protein n=1 Tax=Xenorhabdus szentirmaii DSM 16338 TaxID=1427518 RepID=W1IRR6_9GAMM|nr:hypothetical protein XSR1_110063 [Xenorhabdus szentirmaii DSM 16338]
MLIQDTGESIQEDYDPITHIFDSLHRQKSITCGGRTSKVSYKDTGAAPEQVISRIPEYC